MPLSPRSRSILFLAGGLALVGLGTALLFDGDRPADGGAIAAPGAPRAEEVATPSLDSVPTDIVEPTHVEYEAEELAATTVLWPLRVELDLLEPEYLPTEKGVAPIGSGATARLQGRIAVSDREGARAEVSFVAGANTGRVLHTDVTGSFGASDLYPGLAIVEVRGDRIVGSRRPVRLRQDQVTTLNIGYGRLGSVRGRVVDRDGNGLEGASVTIDGTQVFTGPEGDFFLSEVAGGQLLAEVQLEGYASYEELIMVAAGRENADDRMTFALAPAASLKVAVNQAAGGPGPVQLYLLPGQAGQRLHPASAHRNMRYPWHELNPVEVWPGSPRTIEGLPAEMCRVYAFRTGAEGVERNVNLRAGTQAALTLQLDAAPRVTGRVVHEGEPVAGAPVRLEAPNRVRATLGFFRQGAHFLETAVLPPVPPALQEALTDEAGRFAFSAWSKESPTRFLEARSPDGTLWGGRLVHAGETEVELEIGEAEHGDSELAIDFPGRHQGLPIELLVAGAPRDPWILPPNRPLVVADMPAGRWRVALTWHGTPVHEETLTVRGQTDLEVELPAECIDGQDEEAWRRAGRDYPIGG